jgi:hypothetical protein
VAKELSIITWFGVGTTSWKVLNDRLALEWCTDVLRITQGGKYICLGILTFSKRNDRAGTSSATYG